MTENDDLDDFELKYEEINNNQLDVDFDLNKQIDSLFENEKQEEHHENKTNVLYKNQTIVTLEKTRQNITIEWNKNLHHPCSPEKPLLSLVLSKTVFKEKNFKLRFNNFFCYDQNMIEHNTKKLKDCFIFSFRDSEMNHIFLFSPNYSTITSLEWFQVNSAHSSISHLSINIDLMVNIDENMTNVTGINMVNSHIKIKKSYDLGIPFLNFRFIGFEKDLFM